MPDPSDPQSLNRYSYMLNNPLKYGDPSGHTACVAFAPMVPVVVGCQVIEQIMLHGPEIIALIQQLTISAPMLPAVTDPNTDPTNNAAQAFLQSLGGNTAGPGGLDPNNWDKIQSAIDGKIQSFQDKLDEHGTHLTQLDLEAAQQEAAGNPIQHWIEKGGSPTGHLIEVINSQKGLLNLIKDVQGQLSYVVNGTSPLSPEQRLALQQILSEASKLLDHSERYVP